MRIALIVAATTNNVIGANNAMPWHLPADLRYFKKTTLGKPVVMGRKTFESIGRPLPHRTNIVITRQTDWRAEGVQIAHTLNDAVEIATTLALNERVEEVMVIGGAQLYAEVLPLADRIYLTRIHVELEGDAFFPALAEQEWKEVAREDFCADIDNPHDYSFCVLERQSSC